MRILIIEDDDIIAINIYEYLESKGHIVDVAVDGKNGLHLATTESFDVILLDLGLPNMDGLLLCRKLRNELLMDKPILMLSARDTLADKLSGFDSGADDYLVKPFALKEVEARLEAMHKRYKGKVTNRIVEAGSLCFNPRTMTVSFTGKQIKLSPKCIRLLVALMSEPGRIYSRKELELEAWEEEQSTSDTLRSHMHILRRALIQAGGYDPIETVHGLGYCLAERAQNQA
ncbi:response regulator transcription factor [Nitrosomonas mobilis]|uniref:Transcriptional regulatory protein QseB n=1 Tax=Nitrosomonas mobilis TaxID=51642 RepID=A0A1G5SDT7_9PROT|nr:response regulator transcription factor [Nitrosomonas mobilis]SCZ84579.1 Transcriptional regulatory protein QseB [Nitrosomonas mobilis]HNO75367.1 response regulator transcription factor [Nitrosomonas mobilis]